MKTIDTITYLEAKLHANILRASALRDGTEGDTEDKEEGARRRRRLLDAALARLHPTRLPHRG